MDSLKEMSLDCCKLLKALNTCESTPFRSSDKFHVKLNNVKLVRTGSGSAKTSLVSEVVDSCNESTDLSGEWQEVAGLGRAE